MTTVFYGSDLHLEFGRGNLSVPNGDVLVLAGDVFVPWFTECCETVYQRRRLGKRFHKFFKECSENFGQVVMVPGNHEHYHGTFCNTVSKMRDFLEPFQNVAVLDNSTLQYKDIRFFGSTFWTDVNGSNPVVALQLQASMNDFNLIRYSDASDTLYSYGGSTNKWKPEHMAAENDVAREKLRQFVAECKNDNVFPYIVTHHAPSFESTLIHYRTDPATYGYANCYMEYDIEEFPASLWQHGHVHNDAMYNIGNCTVICNPRGYFGSEPRAKWYKLKMLKIVDGEVEFC